MGFSGVPSAREHGPALMHDAVLFWDEADAMFFDREGNLRSWEVRDVNVLLQEISVSQCLRGAPLWFGAS